MSGSAEFLEIVGQLDRAREARVTDPSLAIELARNARVRARELPGAERKSLEARALIELARNLGSQGETAVARDRALEALALSEEVGDEDGIATACAVLGAGYGLTGETRQAHEVLSRAHEIQKRRGDAGATTSLVLRNLAASEFALGHYEAGFELCDEALEVLRKLGDHRGEGRALYMKAEALLRLGKIEEGVLICRDLVESASIYEDPSLEPRARSLLAQAHSLTGDYRGALEHHLHALSGLREGPSPMPYAGVLFETATTCLKLKAYPDARRLAEKALAIYRETDSASAEAATLSLLSEVREGEGDVASALEFAEKAVALQRKTGHAPGLGSALLRLGGVHALGGRAIKAHELAREALALVSNTGNVREEASGHALIGQACNLEGRYEEAVAAFARAEAIARDQEDFHLLAEVAKLATRAHAAAGEYRLAYERLVEHHQVEWRLFREQTDARLEQLRVTQQLDEARHEAREAESVALRRSAKQLRAIVENTPHVAITAYNSRGELRIWNPAAERIFGYRREELIGLQASELEPFHNEHLPFVDLLRYAEETGSTFGPSELSFRRADGSPGTCLSTVFRVIGTEEDMLLVRMDVDLTERKRTENALRDALSEVEILKDRLAAENVYLQEEIEGNFGYFREIVGQSANLKRALHQVEQVAPTDMTALILGETGTGKELVARAIHRASLRRDRPLVLVNCAALPAGLIESEIFGHEKGAFTGALDQKIGRFELADGGTIFLDEIGDLPLELQAKLLRVLQGGEFERLGSTRTIKVDVRVIAATNRILEQAIERGEFRQDLYYRLSVLPIFVPPLRERKEDLQLLVWHLIRKHGQVLGKTIDSVSAKTMERIAEYDWPGNVRELENVIQRAVLLSPGSTLTIDEPLSDPFSSSRVTPPSLKLEDAERGHILEVLRRCGWKIKGDGNAADSLGLPPSTLRLRMKKLGIVRP